MPVENTVTGIIINCNRERRNGGGIFRVIQVDIHHPIYTHGVLAPIPKLTGLPLIVYRHDSQRDLSDAGLNNEIGATLMIDRNGKTVSEFRDQPGSITIIRKDGKPLTRQAIETIWMFNNCYLEHLEEDSRTAQQMLNRRDFNHFCEDYKEDRLLHGHSSFARLELPL